MPNRDLEKSFLEQRREYSGEPISEDILNAGPFVVFENWYAEALTLKNLEVNAMCLSTVSSDEKPSSRMVLLKGYDTSGFCFYTNYESRKGKELEANKNAALLFYWGPHERQIRIEGVVEKMSAEESDAYFASRPRDAQLSAAMSPQSSVIASRELLEEQRISFEAAHKDKSIERPHSWGGCRLTPVYFEFWQGQRSRFHDRASFRLCERQWSMKRLAP